MKFKIGDKIEFKDFEIIKDLYNKNKIKTPRSLSYVEQFIKKSKTLTIKDIKNNKLTLKEASLWKGPFIVSYSYPQEWFTHGLKPKIDKLLQI